MRGLGWVLAVAALVVACGGSTAARVSPLSSTPFDEITLDVDPGSDRGGTALKADVFADGVVTFDEYERAMNAYAQCVRDEGFEVAGPTLQGRETGGSLSPGEDPRNSLVVWFPGVFDADESERLGVVDLQCQEQWSYAIQFVWREQNTVTGEELQQWLERAWECARQRGTALSDPPTELEAILSGLDGFHDGCVPWE